jgi:hypothetical protein
MYKHHLIYWQGQHVCDAVLDYALEIQTCSEEFSFSASYVVSRGELFWAKDME